MPLPAATVVLLRQDDVGPVVFLVRRHGGIPFMGGAHVFPGGRVDNSDCDERFDELADTIDQTSRMADVDRSLAIGIHVAAVRETFEEAGVLLARDTSGAVVSFDRLEWDLAATRAALAAGQIHLHDVLQRHGWRPAVDTLRYFAHWVTPVIEARRYDTRFFLAGVPTGQTAVHDRRETTAGIWVRPVEAIALCRAGDIALPPPTWTTLRWLEPFTRVDEALEWARHQPVPRIEPQVVEQDGTKYVLLPGDEGVPPLAGFTARETRFVLGGGRWIPIERL